MRIATTPAFNQYLMDNSTVFPYNKLMATRNSCYCKWIMLQGQGNRGIIEFFPVLANSVPNGQLLELLSTETAKPLPPELSDIMDIMHWWGKNKNIDWYEVVTFMIAEALDMDEDYDRKELFRAFISVQVRHEIHEYFAIDSIAADLLWTNWLSWFNATYQIAPQSFRGMALYSFDYVKWAIAQVNYHVFSPVAQTVTSASA
jgi:hypothetical protein